MKKLFVGILLSFFLLPSFTIKPNYAQAYDGRAYDNTQMMDFSLSTESEIDAYYGDPEKRIGDDFKSYLYTKISADNHFLSYDGSTKQSVATWYKITDRNWTLSREINPATYKFASDTADQFYLVNMYMENKPGKGNNNPSKAINNLVNGYGKDETLTYIDHENKKKPNGNIQVDKEHVWAKNHGFKVVVSGSDKFEKGAPTDLHHLVAADHYTNSSGHNDYFYSNVDKSSPDTTVINCYYADGTTGISGYRQKIGSDYIFEPTDEWKGNIARCLLYMATRYSLKVATGNTQAEPYLTLTDDKTLVDDLSTFTGVHQNLSTFLEWNELDPVDEYERKRNDLIYKNVQRNRNPFIDHEEWARRVFDKNYSIDDIDFNIKSEYTLRVGDTLKLADALPDDLTGVNVGSSDGIIELADDKLTVTAKKVGEETLTYTYGEHTKDVKITVVDKPTITSPSIELESDSTYSTLAIPLSDELRNNEYYKFVSQDTNLLEIKEDGSIVTHGVGTVKVKVTLVGPGNNETDLGTIDVIIKAKSAEPNKTSSSSQDSSNTPADTDPKDDSKKNTPMNKWVIIAIIAGAVLLVVIIVVILIVASKNKKVAKAVKKTTKAIVKTTKKSSKSKKK